MQCSFCSLADARWNADSVKPTPKKTAVSLSLCSLFAKGCFAEGDQLLHLVAHSSGLLALSLRSSCRRVSLCEVRRSHTSGFAIECVFGLS
jgi:hypothetical protein